MVMQFTLTMPRNNSWNGKWTGAENLYARTKSLSKSKEEELDGESFYHNFGDGWAANVACKKISSQEAAKIRKKTKGFCGYEWMIDNIIWYGQTEDSTTKQRGLND